MTERTELPCLIDRVERVVDDQRALLELRAAVRKAWAPSDAERRIVDLRIATYLADLDRSSGSSPVAPVL